MTRTLLVLRETKIKEHLTTLSSYLTLQHAKSLSKNICCAWISINRKLIYSAQFQNIELHQIQKTEADLLSDVNDISSLQFQLVFILRHIFKQGFALTPLGLWNKNTTSHSGSGLTRHSANNASMQGERFLQLPEEGSMSKD